MVAPTTVSSPAVDELDIQALANVPPPVVQAPLPFVSPYSATNLPEFMQNRVEVAPGLFGPNQGLLGVAPVGAPADYDKLEQEFVESFASRPEYFGKTYQPGIFMPGYDSPVQFTDKPLSFEDGLKFAAGAKLAYELKDPLQEYIVDPLASATDDYIIEPIKENIVEPLASATDDYILEPIKENIAEPLASFTDDIFIEPIKENIIEPITTNIIEPFGSKVDDTFIEPIKTNIIEPISEDIKNIFPEGFGSSLQNAKDEFLDAINKRFEIVGNTIDGLKEKYANIPVAIDYIGEIENAIKSPNSQTMKAGLNAAESLDMLIKGQEYLPSGSIRGTEIPGVGELTDMTSEVIVDKETGEIISSDPIISDELANNLILAASAYDVAQFVKDPSLESAPNAYISASEIAGEYDIDLPGINSPYVQGPLAVANIFNAAKTLEGGLDTPGEVATVISAVPSASYLGSLGASAVGATETASQLQSLSGIGESGIFSTFGPIAAAYGITTAIPSLLEGGAAGEIPRSKYTLGFEDGRFGETSSLTYDKAQTPTETAKRDFGSTQSRNAIDFVNWLQNSMGYEVDQTALKKWEASDQDELVDQYGYFEKRHRLEDPSVNAADFVTNMLQAGVLKPTAETPPINMQAALNVLTPDVTYYSDYRDIAVAGNVNVPYLLSQINPYPEGYDQTTGQLITPEMQEQRELATAYAQREPAPPQTIGEFIGSITPQEAMALPAGIDYSQPMPDFMPSLSEIISLPGGYRPEVRRQGYVKPMNVIDFETLQRMLPV